MRSAPGASWWISCISEDPAMSGAARSQPSIAALFAPCVL